MSMQILYKSCTKCNQVLSVALFYRKNKTLLRSACKKCTTSSTRDYYLKNTEKHRKLTKRYYRANKESIVEMNKAWAKTSNGAKSLKKAAIKYSAANRKKVNAAWRVGYEIERGRMRRGPCVVCGEPKTHGHHEDYDRPLDVIWLCPQHHKDVHSKVIDICNILQKIDI